MKIQGEDCFFPCKGDSSGKIFTNLYYVESMKFQVPDYSHIMAFAPFSQATGNSWKNLTISHVM